MQGKMLVHKKTAIKDSSIASSCSGKEKCKDPHINPNTTQKDSIVTANDSLANKPKKPFVPPLCVKNAPSTFKNEKEEGRRGSWISVFPKNIQSLGEYRHREDKRAKAIGTAQLPYWFIERDKRGVPSPKKGPYVDIEDIGVIDPSVYKSFDRWKESMNIVVAKRLEEQKL